MSWGRVGRRTAVAIVIAAVVGLAACGSPTASSGSAVGGTGGTVGATWSSQRAAVKGLAENAMSRYHLRSLIVRVSSGGRDVYTAAFGTSMTGVKAEPSMHFRNGAFGFATWRP